VRFDIRIILAALVAVIALAAGAYELGRRSGVPGPAAPLLESALKPRAASAPSAAQPQPGAPPPSAAGQFTHFRVGNKNVKDIFADEGSVWVGFSGGVIRYDLKTGGHQAFDTTSGLMSNGVFHVSRLGGRIAVGTYGGGMSLFDAATEKWENYNIPDGLGDAFVYDILETSWGDVWIATWSGANRVKKGALRDPAKWELFTVESTKGGLPNDWVYGLAEGKNGEVWFATEGGLARYKDGQWSNWTHAQGLGADYEKVKEAIKFKNDPGQYSSHHAQQKVEQGLEDVTVAYNPNYIVSLLVDRRDGAVWAGTWGGGLARFDGAAFTSYTTAEGLPSNHIFMLYQDPEGELWAGTSDGLARMAKGAVKRYTTENGLFSNNVFSMAVDRNGDVWVGSFGGVARLAPSLLQ